MRAWNVARRGAEQHVFSRTGDSLPRGTLAESWEAAARVSTCVAPSLVVDLRDTFSVCCHLSP